MFFLYLGPCLERGERKRCWIPMVEKKYCWLTLISTIKKYWFWCYWIAFNEKNFIGDVLWNSHCLRGQTSFRKFIESMLIWNFLDRLNGCFKEPTMVFRCFWLGNWVIKRFFSSTRVGCLVFQPWGPKIRIANNMSLVFLFIFCFYNWFIFSSFILPSLIFIYFSC